MTTDIAPLALPPAPRVLVLVATIPSREPSCTRLFVDLAKQSRKPDGIILVLDGYGEAAAPRCSLPIVATYRTTQLSGPGARWRVVQDFNPEDIIICIDDDTMLCEAPGFVKALVTAVEESDGAAGAMGRGTDNKYAPPGRYSRGDLIHAAGSGLAVRAKHLAGLQEFAAEVRTAGGPDALGLLGDDDALISAYLWKSGVKIRHAKTGNIFAAPGTQANSQTAARREKHESLDAQKQLIQKLTGWPCFPKVQPTPAAVHR